MNMVQVTSEAKASPIITALTMTSADRNIDQGERSCGTGAAGFSACALSGAATGAEGAAAIGAA